MLQISVPQADNKRPNGCPGTNLGAVAGPERGLTAILPAGAIGAEMLECDGEEPPKGLYEEELRAIANASDGRRREFAGGRACARHALDLLGVPPGPLPIGVDGAPEWPAGVVGSITHKGRYRAAAVALSRDLAGLGVDAELDEPLPTGVLEAIASAQELDEVQRLLAEQPGTRWDRLLFSAKEAAMKASHPLVIGPAAMRAAEARLNARAGTFAAVVTPDGGQAIAGAWTARPGFLVTVATVATRETKVQIH